MVQVKCIKCDQNGTLSVKKTTSQRKMYQYHYIQHSDPETRKRKWCYIGKYDSLPEDYKLIIHKHQGLYTNYPQVGSSRNNLKLSSISNNTTLSASGCGLAWSRTGAPQAPDPGSNPGCRTTRS